MSNSNLSPEEECLTMAAYNYDSRRASQKCIDQWKAWDESCWYEQDQYSEEDLATICYPGFLGLVLGIGSEMTWPNDEDADCMTEKAFSWSNDYCGDLWLDFDKWCMLLVDL